jgi:hypothetical protein
MAIKVTCVLMTKPSNLLYISCIFRHPSAFFFEQRTDGLRDMEHMSIGVSCSHKRKTDGQIILSFEANHVKRWNVKNCPHGAERLQERLALFVNIPGLAVHTISPVFSSPNGASSTTLGVTTKS